MKSHEKKVLPSVPKRSSYDQSSRSSSGGFNIFEDYLLDAGYWTNRNSGTFALYPTPKAVLPANKSKVKSSLKLPDPAFAAERRLARKRVEVSNWAAAREKAVRRKSEKKLLSDWDDALAESWSSVSFVLPFYKDLFTDIGLDRRDYAYFERRALNEGWPFLSQLLPQLDKALLKGLSSGTFVPPDDFHCLKGEKVPRFLRELWIQVFTPQGELLEVGVSSPIAVQCLRQIFGFVYKADVPCTPDLNESVVRQFILTERQLRDDLDDLNQEGTHCWDHSLELFVAARLISWVFGDYDRNDLKFRHGPGVTSNCPIEDKFEAPLNDLPSVREFRSSFFFNEGDMVERDFRFKRSLDHVTLFQRNNVAELKLVPKDARGPRVISAEPMENQWAQQGIRSYMYAAVDRSPLTSGLVNFTDQSVNRRMAYAASVTRNWATLDLKEASDRVTCDLVERLFRGCPELLQDFVNTRSEATKLPDGQVLPLVKFAPMGSALCFPVLAMSIWSIVVARFISLGFSPYQASRLVFVFGDDVIVPSELASDAISALEQYLLLVNRDKSFVSSRFAESCGGDFFDGNDVSPKRLRSCPKKEVLGPETLASLVPLAQELDRLGYARTAERIYVLVESKCGKLPYGYACSRFLNRIFMPFMGKSAFEATRNRLKLKFGFCPSIQNKAWWYKAPVVESAEKIYSSSVSFGGHASRIWSSLGGTSLPAPGEFDKRQSLTIRARRIPEYDFSEFPANRWVPGPDSGIPDSDLSFPFMGFWMSQFKN